MTVCMVYGAGSLVEAWGMLKRGWPVTVRERRIRVRYEPNGLGRAWAFWYDATLPVVACPRGWDAV